MAVQRYISSSFWSDDWVDSLSLKEKLLYMFLLTNENTSICGIYKISIKRMKDDTGIPRGEVKEILDKFSEAKKAYYVDEYIILPKWLKHQNLNNQKVRLGTIRALNALPESIIKFLQKDKAHFFYDINDFIDCSNIKNDEKDSPDEKPMDNPKKDTEDKSCSKVGKNGMTHSDLESKTYESYENDLLLPDNFNSNLDSNSNLNSSSLDIYTNQDILHPPQEKNQSLDKKLKKQNDINIRVEEEEDYTDIQHEYALKPGLVDLAKSIYNIFVSLGINKPNKFQSFYMRDFNLGVQKLKKQNIAINLDLIKICENYAKVIALKREHSTWWETEPFFDGFCNQNTIIQFLPERFNLDHFRLKSTRTQSGAKKFNYNKKGKLKF